MELVIAGLVVTVGCVAAVLYLRAAAKPDLTCSVVHEAKTGCPPGYTREDHPRFTEYGGEKTYACLSSDPAKQSCVDEIRPWEKMTLRLGIVVDQDEPAERQPKPEVGAHKL